MKDLTTFRLLSVMAKPKIKETDLYPPIKLLLEGQGYEVKGEIGAADVVGVRGQEDPLIIELKIGFSLALFHQAVERQAITEAVYVAVPRKTGPVFRKALRANISLCRRLGLGLITVRTTDGFVEIHNDPGPYKPRQSKQKRGQLLREFSKRVGDPNLGGATRTRLITAYRQDALRCVKILHEVGPTKAAKVAQQSRVEKARRLMADNHYGWFERIGTGIYTLTPQGNEAVNLYSGEIRKICQSMQYA